MRNRKGFLLVSVLFLLMFLTIIVPVMVNWVKEDTKISVKDQKSSLAFQLAEAAIDRGYWKLKISSSTFADLALGIPTHGYNFDITYADIDGGTYRIKLSSGPAAGNVTIYGEGRDSMSRETRAIKAVFSNTSIPGAIISGGMLGATGASVVHWGPIMAMGDINLSGGAATCGFPRKFSRQVVRPLDPTGDINPSNTDGKEWWSNYDVPELPRFDFTELRASAAATGTLNCDDVNVDSYTYTSVISNCDGTGCADPGQNCDCTNTTTGSACADSGANCDCTNTTTGAACTDSGSNCDCSVTTIGSACVDPGAHCDCTATTTGSACVDSGAQCDCTNVGTASGVCTGSGCTDSDGAGAGCLFTNTCTGSACTDSDGAASNCALSRTCTGSGCIDTDGAASDCERSNVCAGSGCLDSDGAASGCTRLNTCIGSGCSDTGADCDCVVGVSTTVTTVTGMNCCSSSYYGGPVTCSYGGSGCTNCTVKDINDQSTLRDMDYTWYWDNNVDWTGQYGIKGTVIVRGNMRITGNDNYCPNCVLTLPPDASQEYQKIDTSAHDQYPGDTGLGSNAATYTIGTCGVSCEGGNTGTLGLYGFLYVGGDFARVGGFDCYGAMWVKGNVSGGGNTTLFYNPNLSLPVLNVVLFKESWEETAPSTASWP